MGLFAFDKQYAMFDATPVQNQFILEYMPSAPGDHVKVYLYGLMQCYHPGEEMTLTQMSHELNLTQDEILAAYRHWERRGLVRRISNDPPVFQYLSVYQQFLMRDAAPRDAAYEDFAESLYALFGEDRKLHGRETTMAYEWVEDMGLPQAVVLMLINYMITNHGKQFSFNTAQKKAVELAQEKVSTIEEAEEVLGREKKIEDGVKRVIRRLGRARPASMDERNLYAKWVKEWGFAPEAIEAACVETLKGQPTMQYLDGILRGLRERSGGGMTTARQVESLRQGEQDRTAPLKALLQVMNIRGVSVNESTLSIYDEMRKVYPDEIILMAGRACAANGGKLDDVQKTLNLWKKHGMQTAEEIRESLRQIEEQNTFLGALFELWGRPGRPVAADRRMLERWQRDYGFDEEIILLCASYAAQADKPIAYLDSLLKAYHAKGLTTVQQIQAEREAYAASAAAKPAAPAQRPVKTVREQQYTQREYTENDELPAWMQQKLKELNGDA